MNTKYNEIKYHKDIEIEKAKELFEKAFRDEVTIIFTPNKTFMKDENGKVSEVPKFI